jgi:hypothetical protein
MRIRKNISWSMVFVAASVMAATSTANAQEQQAFTQQYQSWLAFNFQGPIAGRLSLTGDIQYRAWDNGTPQAMTFRAALLYRVAEGLSVGIGYLWIPAWRSRDLVGFFDEHRPFQVLVYQYTHAQTGIGLQLRTRFEERLRHPADSIELGFRVRQLVRATLPLTNNRRLTLVAWDEIFFSLGDAGREPLGIDAMGRETYTPQWEFSGFDQNRVFLGVGWQFVATTLRAELGYMNQYIRRPNNPNNGGDLMGHTAALTFFYNWH